MPGITFTSGGGTSEVGYVTLKSLGATNAVQLTTSNTMTPIDEYPYPVPSEAIKRMVAPSPSYFPSPAVCVNSPCNHQNGCPVIWIKQDFLLRPHIYSDYWSLSRAEDGSFIVKLWNTVRCTEYRTFIWKVSKDTTLIAHGHSFWIAKWVD